MYLEEMVMLPMLVPNLELVQEAEVEVVVAQVLVQEAEVGLAVGLAVGLGQITDYKTVTMDVTLSLEFAFKQIYFGAKHHNWCFAVFGSHFYATKKIPIL